MKNKTIGFTLLTVILAVFVVILAGLTPAADAANWQAQVDPWVLETAAAQGQTEFLVFLAEQADLSAAADLETKLEKGTYVFETLTAVANRTQPAVMAELDALGVTYKPYWVANMIWVRGDITAVQRLAQRDDVAHIYANPTVHFDPPSQEEQLESMAAIEWNILQVNADDAWGLGYTGQGAVIGGQDTGYDWDHPALKNQYRGWNGASADHNYSWHDSIHSGGGVCGADSPEPCDDHGHGTHTMGTMVGDDGGSNQIGMAPGARWISCRNMDQGNGTPTTYSECYQWFIAPTDLNDQNPNPAMAPDAINNSWSCPAIEGCTDPNIMLTVVNNVRAAGILTAHSAGNGGSGCSTVSDPAAIYSASYSVGSTTSADTISSFSSRGPVLSDGSNRLKPNISAPGSNIRSSVPGGGYQGGWNGTSMAAPHVAGLTALLISADPSLAGQVDQLEAIMNVMAIPRTSNQNCGSVPGSEIPNNTFGHGRIDAIRHGLAIELTASADNASQGDLLTYTFTVTHAHIDSLTSNVVLTDAIPAGTTFYTSTTPYTLNNGVISWNIASMDVFEVQTITLVVMVTANGGTIDNDQFGAYSDEVAQATFFGRPPQTTVIFTPGSDNYAPVIIK